MNVGCLLIIMHAVVFLEVMKVMSVVTPRFDHLPLEDNIPEAAVTLMLDPLPSVCQGCFPHTRDLIF